MLDPKLQAIIDSATTKTEEEFASTISSYTSLKDTEIIAWTPSQQDREKFAELLNLVSSTTKSNSEKAEAMRNINGLAEIALKMLGKFLL